MNGQNNEGLKLCENL